VYSYRFINLFNHKIEGKKDKNNIISSSVPKLLVKNSSVSSSLTKPQPKKDNLNVLSKITSVSTFPSKITSQNYKFKDNNTTTPSLNRSSPDIKTKCTSFNTSSRYSSNCKLISVGTQTSDIAFEENFLDSGVRSIDTDVFNFQAENSSSDSSIISIDSQPLSNDNNKSTSDVNKSVFSTEMFTFDEN
jgi:hypothetical protein